MVLFYILIGSLGACIGSFINMAAYRIPKSLYFAWFIECYNFLQIKPDLSRIPDLDLNIFYPRSHCPQCKQQISIFHNIPIFSYIFLKGKCAYCNNSIPIRYLLVELITVYCSIAIAIKFNCSYQGVFGLLLTWILILQSVIDFNENIIPDELTLPTLWLGLMVNHFQVFTNGSEALFGAIIGYIFFWSIYWLFKVLTGKEGLGYGDFKLLSMLGAWLGLKQIFFIVLIASTIASIVGIILIFYYKVDRSKPLPFGPYLAFAGWIMLLYGKVVQNWLGWF